MLVGFSLSFCVKDILLGRVKEEDVMVIFCGTNIRTREAMTSVIARYSQGYWGAKNKKKASAIIYRLLFAGKLLQARAFGLEAPNIASGVWEEYLPKYENHVCNFFRAVNEEKDPQ